VENLARNAHYLLAMILSVFPLALQRVNAVMFLWNSRNQSPSCTVSHPRRLDSSVTPLWKPYNLHCEILPVLSVYVMHCGNMVKLWGSITCRDTLHYVPHWYQAGPICCSPSMCMGAHGSAFGWGTAIQAGRSHVQFPMVSLEFFTDIILPATLWPWGWLSL
jgi:hypothetical protein